MTAELILLGVAIILLIVMIIHISITTLFWTRIGWFFEDIWHWLKRRRIIRSLFTPNYLTLANDSCFGEEDITDEDIHEIMNLIHNGNPLTQLQRQKLFSIKFRPVFHACVVQPVESQQQRLRTSSLEAVVIPTPVKNMLYLCGYVLHLRHPIQSRTWPNAPLLQDKGVVPRCARPRPYAGDAHT